MHKGIDCGAKLNARTAAAAKAAGFDFVGRYLVPDSGTTAWKALTRAEAELITAAGLRLLTVWELGETRPRGGYSAGAADGARALKLALDIGMPVSGIIYFAVDYDAQDGEMQTIAEYLRGARDNTGPYEIGVYGSYRVVEAMAARLGQTAASSPGGGEGAICKGFWQCVAWSGGKRSPALTVYQSDWSGTAAAKAAAAKIGVSVDLDECPDMDRTGIWNYNTEDEEEEEMQRYNTIAELPGWAKDTVKKLCDRSIIKGQGGGKDAEGYPADMNLSEDMLRLLVWNDRAGLYDDSLERVMASK